ATSDAQGNGDAVTPAAQWLLDNQYLVDESILQVKRDLPPRFYRELPKVDLPGGASVPRALLIAWAYVAHTDSTVMPHMLTSIVEGYQSVEPLRIGELWALPSFMRFVLAENLRRISLRVDRAREMRRIANETADRLRAGDAHGNQEALLAAYAMHARDASFATQLLYRLRDGSQSAGTALMWLERELEKHGSDAEEITLTEHQTLASGNVTMGNIIRGLRLINDIDWTEWFESVSQVDALLRASSDFAALDFPSRDQYRATIELLARRSGLSEYEVTERAVGLSKVAGEMRPAAEGEAPRPHDSRTDLGFFLIGARSVELEEAIGYKPTVGQRLLRGYRKTGWFGIAVPVAALTVLFLLLAMVALRGADLSPAAIVVLLVLFSFPAVDGAVGLFNTLMLLFIAPVRLVGYEYKEGVPAEACTLVVVPTLIGSRGEIEEMVRRLEVHYLANLGGELYYALLSDWPDSQDERTEVDLELLNFAKAEIAALNTRHPPGRAKRFHLLHRRRLYNEAEGVWMGWERKRGKLNELDLLLRGDPDTTFLPVDDALPSGVVHVLTLDADTRLTRDAAVKLSGKLSHPLNRPVLGPDGKTVVAGYGVLQPRVTPSLTTGDEASFFQRVFSSNRGLDPYVFAVSDLYQDVFDEGTFTGKGIYHVDAMEAALAGRIPENAVLSHDLLEGAFARAALVTDIELVEDYPAHYAVDASRHHRWARGDWQLLPYIFDPRSGVPGISRWKMLDNLRRTMTPIFWVAAAIAAWTLMPFVPATQWLMVLVVTLFVAPTLDLVRSIVPKSTQTTLRGHVAAFVRDFANGTAQVALRVMLLGHIAWMMGDAILRTLHRLFISRRHMLEWRTASQVQRNQSDDVASYYRFMWGSLVVAALAVGMPTASGSTGVFLGLLFAAMWATAPAFAWIVSRSAETSDKLEVTPSDREALRRTARRTWRYFEDFVTAEHNMLPPDNFQETPAPVVAHRTSPTNIGMYLLSVISARDFGWIGMSDAIDRVSATLATVGRLETYRGHLLNWYDTQTLKPLYPRYLSSVDSGNLAGHLIAISSAFEEWAEAPAAFMHGDFDGILDSVGVLEESLAELPDDRRQLRPLRQRLGERIAGMRRAVESIKGQPETAPIRTLNLAVHSAEIAKFARALDQETQSAASEVLAGWATRLQACCEAHIADAHFDGANLDHLRFRLRETARLARTIAFQMDFSFLMRADRKLLSIGYRIDDHQLDESCYDLLASEARLASLFAIAKGDIPTEHWFRLGRPIVEIGYRGALMSWSGSMFEYLMPPLVMKEPEGGILNQTSKLIIRRQIAYGRSKQIPWGISEAAYNARDVEMTYQYTNFGVPGLGLKRGLAQNTVIAPYATILASQFVPAAAVANLKRLADIGALGAYGFYDAVDYTPARVPVGRDCAVVRNYFAHHQGMSIVAVGNVVHEGRMRDRFHRDPVIEAAELLLQEKAPRDIPVATVRSEPPERDKVVVVVTGPDMRRTVAPAHAPRAVNVLSNGHYSIMVTATGGGYSRFDDLSVTRWQPDPVEDRLGTYLFLRDSETGEWWSATTAPKQALGERAEALFTDDKATFLKTVGNLRTEVECVVASEANGECRRITIYNDGRAERHIEVTSFAELVLAPEASDSAHPAFSKMFVKTEIDAARGAIFAERRKRAPGDRGSAVVHFMTAGTKHAGEIEAETDRRAFIGRGRSLADPAAMQPHARLAGHDGFVLDPIVSLRRRVRIPANKKVSLTFWTIAGTARPELEDAMARLDHPESFARQGMHAWTRSQVQTRHVGLTLAEAASVQKLASFLLYPDAALRGAPEAIAAGLGAQSALWPMAISGDFPIFALRISDIVDLEIVAKGLRMQEYLRARGLVVDFVVVNEQASSYVQDLQAAIDALCENSRLRGGESGPRQHIFAVRRDLMDERSYRTLLSSARVLLHSRNGKIEDQIERAVAQDMSANAGADVRLSSRDLPPLPASALANFTPRRPASGDGLDFWNGFGGFADGGKSYVVRFGAANATPQPWVNIIANPAFGFHVSAEGAAFTWSRNSRDFQLTPWTNDPVVNRPGEALYIRDLDSGAIFSPFACIPGSGTTRHEARHGQGFSSFSARHEALTADATMLVDPVDPVRITRLRLKNHGHNPVRLRVYAYAEWVLGNSRAKTVPVIVPTFDAETGTLLARNPYSLEFGERVAFLASDRPAQSVTADRQEFLGVSGSVAMPGAVARGAALSGTVEAGRDICATMARDVVIASGEEADLFFLMGDATSAEDAGALVLRHRERDFEQRLAENDAAWRGFLDTLQVETPDKSLDAMVNHWLPYQALACRIRARAGFYQASGAFGFRDQLQDTMALLLHDPKLARAQIVNAASRQFAEGDVQHWWLPRSGAGVRTMISDDVVWLAYSVAHFVKVTGDRSILDEQLPFILGDVLKPGEHDAFFTPEISKEKKPVYEHCARALDLAVERSAASGLPLILGGDWNDGMNRVGEAGRGESVWLGWFLLKTIHDVAPLAAERGDAARTARWLAHAERLKGALESTGWDGDWYRRGSFDDGTPLGSASVDECRIDSIAQSWSVLSGQGDKEKSRQAMASADAMLVDADLQIVRLFTPPFEHTDKDPGYIKAYPPGVRENGGQYTHAAAWFVIALAELGLADEAHRCFRMLNPINHALDREAAERYRVEPYVVAADIYSEGPLAGRGGWTWYTGSAGWLYRAAVEGILGISKEGNRLRIRPVLPSDWGGYAANMVLGETKLRIEVVVDDEIRSPSMEIDGAAVEDDRVPLDRKGAVHVLLRVPRIARADADGKQPASA
ncbi:MAG: glucoamylase family protein, partial [Mesorhizobium sp.]|nr:glucoamylase family protein [Mesorhizobium sp.]